MCKILTIKCEIPVEDAGLTAAKLPQAAIALHITP